MNLLKARVFLQKHKKIIIVSELGILFVILFLLCKSINKELVINNPTMFGVLGTLLGAIIGGVFSLMGSVWVNSKQQRAVQNIKRKNVIYSPLYDELVDIQNSILEQNPYPNYIVFKKDRQTILPHPQFSAWSRIKADTRYLEVPDLLRKQMDKLENSIHEYQEIRGIVNDEIKDILNSVLVDNGLSPCTIINIGEVISRDILSNRHIDIYHEAMEIGSDKSLNDTLRNTINAQIFQKAECTQSIIEVRKRYDNWINVQKKTIEMLSLLIKQVILLYEG